MVDDPAPGASRFFAAPRAALWEALTRPEQIARWLGPPGVSTTLLSQDVRPGGTLHYAMSLPTGARMWGKSVYRELDEPFRVVWVNSFANEAGDAVRAPFFGDRFPLLMLNTVALAEEGEGTRLRLDWEPLDATAEERRTVANNAAAFRAGWNASFDQLDRFLARAR